MMTSQSAQNWIEPHSNKITLRGQETGMHFNQKNRFTVSRSAPSLPLMQVLIALYHDLAGYLLRRPAKGPPPPSELLIMNFTFRETD